MQFFQRYEIIETTVSSVSENNSFSLNQVYMQVSQIKTIIILSVFEFFRSSVSRLNHPIDGFIGQIFIC